MSSIPRVLVALVLLAVGGAVHACRAADPPAARMNTVPMKSQRVPPVPTRVPRARIVHDEPGDPEPLLTPSSSDPTAPQRALVVGTVRTDDGATVPGAFVSLGDLDASQDTAFTDANGYFEINEVPSYSAVEVVAHVGGSTWRGTSPADGAPIRVDVTVRRQDSPEHRVVLVHVVGHDGTPIPRARAEAVGGELAEEWRWDTGNLVMSAGACFPVRVMRWKDGAKPVYFVSDARDDDGTPLPYGPALVTVDLEGADDFEVRLPPGVIHDGTVETAAGHAAVDVVVRMTPALPDGCDLERLRKPGEAFTWTDASGRFAFGGVAHGSATLRIDPHEGVHGGCDAREVRIGDDRAILRLAPASPRSP